MRSLPSVTLGVAALAASVFAFGAEAEPPWGPETPPFNIEVILRDVTGGSGFGHVKFRQPNDNAKIVYLDTWVRDLAPNHAYRLQRAVETNPRGSTRRSRRPAARTRCATSTTPPRSSR